MSVQVYVDLRSQPCRAITIFLKNSEIPYEIKNVDLFKGEHKKPEYTDIFPLSTVPGMKDGDYHLSETVAMFRYLTSKYAGKFPDHWYPADLKARGQVDEYLSFHHSGIRGGCVPVFVSAVFVPMQTGKGVSQERREREAEKLKQGLDKFERAFIKDNHYICGNEITFADIMAICEFSQFIVNGYDVAEGRPRLREYIDRVKERLNPIFDDVHATAYGWRDSLNKK